MEKFGFEITVSDGMCCRKYKIINNALQYVAIKDFVDGIAHEFGATVQDLGKVSLTEIEIAETKQIEPS